MLCTPVFENINITKVQIKWHKDKTIGEANDFYKKPKDLINNIYHHVGIYSFKPSTLNKFVNLPLSKNEKILQ